MAKKSFYLLVTALIGASLFFILDRTLVFLYLYLVATGSLGPGPAYYQFLAADYFTLALALIGGAWYGIWLGMYWFEKVYNEKSHGGLAHHIRSNYFTWGKPKSLPGKMSAVKQRLEKDLWALEDLAKNTAQESGWPEPKVRRVVRKRAPKKLNKTSNDS